ncbi:MAG: metallophosphoesterase [Thermoguttaceae bacterium]|nr:metallophosphoesterase [Thermoguttaceae bacterium]
MAARLLGRRAFLERGCLVLVGATLPCGQLRAAEEAAPLVRIGLLTDLHHADRPPSGSRYYRETLSKCTEAADHFRRDKVDHVAELGDLIDSADSLETEKGYLRRIRRELAAAPGTHHFVLGNHCVSALTKPEFLEIVGQERSYYSFETGGHRIVVLDACFRGDGEPYGRHNFTWTDANIPAEEIDWLRSELKAVSNGAIVLVHQRLDAEPPYGIKNAAEVRKVLEDSGRVLAVLQGHYHPGDYREVKGIHYCTLSAMIEGSGPENNAYAVMDVLPGGAIRIAGFRRQRDCEWH